LWCSKPRCTQCPRRVRPLKQMKQIIAKSISHQPNMLLSSYSTVPLH
jgi:hypothetical protein